MIDKKQHISNYLEIHSLSCRNSGKVFAFFPMLILSVIISGSINIIQDVFAQTEENVVIYVHIDSKPFDSGIIEINDAINSDYYEEKAYRIDSGKTTTVQFNPPPNAISIGESYHVAPYSTVNKLCGSGDGINHPGNAPENIYIKLQPCTTR